MTNISLGGSKNVVLVNRIFPVGIVIMISKFVISIFLLVITVNLLLFRLLWANAIFQTVDRLPCKYAIAYVPTLVHNGTVSSIAQLVGISSALTGTLWGRPPLIDGPPLQRFNNADLWSFLCCQREQSSCCWFWRPWRSCASLYHHL